MPTKGGPVKLVKVIGDADLRQNGGLFELMGGPAQPVEGFELPLSRKVEGGAAIPVYIVTDAQINDGTFSLRGGPALPLADLDVVGSGVGVVQGAAVPVYVVGGVLGGAGASPPDAPTDLTATAVSGTQIDLAWTASTGATGYKIERSDGGGSSFAQIDAVGAVTAYEDTGLDSGIYYYRIRATNAAGDSDYSNTANAVVYLLRDEFTTDEAAPLTTPRTAEPGPGTIVITDTGNKMSISGGALQASGNTAIGNPGIWSATNFGIVGGQAILATFNPGTTSPARMLGWDSDQAGGFSLGLYFAGAGELRTQDNAGLSNVSTFAAVPYRINVVMRPDGGALSLIKGGAFTEWTLIWVGTFAMANAYASFTTPTGAGGSYGLDDFRVIVLPAPWNTNYGVATYVDLTPTADDVATSEADAIQYFNWQAMTGETLIIRFRRTDDDNCYRLECDQAGATIKLFRREAGVDTELDAGKTQTWTNGTSYRIAIQHQAEIIKIWVGAGTKQNVTAQTFNQTATGAKVSGFASSSSWSIWPWTLSGDALAVLNAENPT
jgi:hypothetical protein